MSTTCKKDNLVAGARNRDGSQVGPPAHASRVLRCWIVVSSGRPTTQPVRCRGSTKWTCSEPNDVVWRLGSDGPRHQTRRPSDPRLRPRGRLRTVACADASLGSRHRVAGSGIVASRRLASSPEPGSPAAARRRPARRPVPRRRSPTTRRQRPCSCSTASTRPIRAASSRSGRGTAARGASSTTAVRRPRS